MNENFISNCENPELQEILETTIEGQRFDKKFCYSLLATTGICTVPLSGFNSDYEGVRLTLLEEDEKKYRNILETMKAEIVKWRK